MQYIVWPQVRMNGGTNIALAIQRAGTVFKAELPPDAVSMWIRVYILRD